MTGVSTSPARIGRAVTGRLRRHHRPEPVSAPLLASDALKCSRRIGFRLFGVPPDIRYTRDELARFEDGDYVDSVASEVYAQQLDARTQVPFHWLPEVPLKGKADAGYRDNAGRKVIVETKSANERAWSRAVGLWDGVPAAPKPEWLVQAGLAACSPQVRADDVHIVLVDNERFETAEWVLGVDQPLDLPERPADLDPDTGEIVYPTIRSLTMAEVDRQAIILDVCEQGALPARELPGYGRVAMPPARDMEKAEPWACRYCGWQPTCVRLPAGEVADFAEIPA